MTMHDGTKRRFFRITEQLAERLPQYSKVPAGSLVVPHGAGVKLFRRLHELGHCGRMSVMRFIRQGGLYIPTMARIAKEFRCDACELVHFDLTPARTSLLKADKPFHLVSMDYTMIPHGYQSREYQYILVLRDLYSGWTEIIPQRDAKAATLCETLTKFCARHTVPAALLSDNGPCFVSAHYRTCPGAYLSPGPTSTLPRRLGCK